LRIQQFNAGESTVGPTKGTLMDRFRRSWELLKARLPVMSENKKLLAFPIIISTLTLFMALPVPWRQVGVPKNGATVMDPVEQLEGGGKQHCQR